MQLKHFIKEKLPDIEIILSTPTIRTDDGKAALTVRQLANHMRNLNIETIDNSNITSKHLGYKGLHLNRSGTNALTENLVSALRKF